MRYAIYGLLGFAALLLIGWGTSWFGLVAKRPMAKYAEETNRLVESESRRRIDGVNQGIAQLCLNMRRDESASGKRAFAAMILADANSFQKPELLTPDNQACIAEAKGL